MEGGKRSSGGEEWKDETLRTGRRGFEKEKRMIRKRGRVEETAGKRQRRRDNTDMNRGKISW